jgi:RNA recognition motif-containing protein
MRIYVGGLPYQTTEQELIDLFAPIGHVTMATVITDRDTGRSKGFGFVQMDNEQEAQSAIAQLNNTTIGDRTMIVSQARERQAAGSERHSNSNNRGNRY